MWLGGLPHASTFDIEPFGGLVLAEFIFMAVGANSKRSDGCHLISNCARHTAPQCEHLAPARPHGGWFHFLQGQECKEAGDPECDARLEVVRVNRVEKQWRGRPSVGRAFRPQSSLETLGQPPTSHPSCKGPGQRGGTAVRANVLSEVSPRQPLPSP